MRTFILTEYSETARERIDALLHILSPGAPKVNEEHLKRLLSCETFKLFLAEADNGELAGMLTLTGCHVLSHTKWWIEDVVVDDRFRGQGAGRALVKAAVTHVRALEEHPTLYLTSNPSRTAARALYRSEGFEEYETGVFRLPKA